MNDLGDKLFLFFFSALMVCILISFLLLFIGISNMADRHKDFMSGCMDAGREKYECILMLHNARRE